MVFSITDLIHTLKLSICHVEYPRFMKVIRLVKFINNEYMPTNRNVVDGKLLNLNYDIARLADMKLLKANKQLFRIRFSGDGATIAKLLILTILTSGAYTAAFYRELVGYTK